MLASRTRRSSVATALFGAPLAFAFACGGGDAADTTGGESGGAETSGADAGTSDSGGDGDTGAGDVQRWELRMGGFSPSPFLPTWYGCETWTFQTNGPIHIVGFEPKVDDPHVHHYVVEVFDSEFDLDPSEPCFENPFNEMVWGWGPGGEPLNLPDDVGMRAGETGVVTFRVQVHYDNPLGDSFQDFGGFDVLYTENLRTFDAGIMTQGDVGSNDVIPPGDPAYVHETTCANPYTGSGEPANVIGGWLHAHEIGSVLSSEIVHPDQTVTAVGFEDPYDFDRQTFKPLDATVNAGDMIRTTCVYDSTGRTEDTQFGETTTDEMCINFLLYYPDGTLRTRCGNL